MSKHIKVVPVGRTGADEWQPSAVDLTTFALEVIDYAHHEIHSPTLEQLREMELWQSFAGSHYFVKGFTTLAETTDTVDFCLQTPDTTKWAHLIFSIQGTGETGFEIFEDAIFSTDGAVVTPINNNRNSSNVSGLGLYVDSTVTTDGNSIYTSLVGTTLTPSKASGGDVGREAEIILKQNTGYIFRFTTGSTGNTIDYGARWYEHTDKS
jgi:hypothetical protein